MPPELQQQLMIVQQDNPGLLQSMLGIYEMNTRFRQSLGLRSADNSAELGRVAVNAAGLAQREYNQAEAGIVNLLKANKISMVDIDKAFQKNPELKLQYDELVSRRDAAKTTYNQWVPLTKKMFGIEAEQVFTPLEESADTSTGVDPAVIARYQTALRENPTKASSIRAKFKETYGRDLP
jgi:hypothetical protein